MSTKKRVVSAALAAAVGVSLLCGFGVAKKEYVYQQFETAEPVTSVTVQDASANVTIQAADTDHITVRYGTLPDEEPLYDISVQDGRLVVKARDDVDVDTTDDDGPALVRVRIEGHSMNPWSDRELTVTLPDKQYEQLEAGLAVGTLKVEGVDAKTLSAAAAAGEAEVSDVQAGPLAPSRAAGEVYLRAPRGVGGGRGGVAGWRRRGGGGPGWVCRGRGGGGGCLCPPSPPPPPPPLRRWPRGAGWSHPRRSRRCHRW